MGRLVSVIALAGVLSTASGFSASEPTMVRCMNNYASVPNFSTKVCPVGRRRRTTLKRMVIKADGQSEEEKMEKVITTTDSSEGAFSLILFPTLVLKFIVIMLVKSASDFVEYTPQYFERLASSLSLGGGGNQQADNASGNTMAINPEASHHHHDETGFSILDLPTLFLKFIVIMMVKSASDAVYYPSQYLERLLKPPEENNQVQAVASEEVTTSKITASPEEEYIEEAAFSLFLLPVLLLKFSIVMLVKVAKDMADYTLPYLESLARLETITIEKEELKDEVEIDVDFSEVLYTKDGDYWVK